MKKLSSVVLAVFLFATTLLFVTPNANAQTTFPLIYGGTYLVQNGYNNGEGGYLDTNGVGCEGKLLCVPKIKKTSDSVAFLKAITETQKALCNATVANPRSASDSPAKIAVDKSIAEATSLIDDALTTSNSEAKSDKQATAKSLAKAENALVQAIASLSLIGDALATSNSTSTSDKQATAESLAKAETVIGDAPPPTCSNPPDHPQTTSVELLAIAKTALGDATAIAESVDK